MKHHHTIKHITIVTLIFMLQWSCMRREQKQEKLILENNFELPDTSRIESKKKGPDASVKREPSALKELSEKDLKSYFPGWSNLNLLEESDSAYSGNILCKLDIQTEYSVTFNKKIADLNIDKPDFVDLTWMVKRMQEPTPLILVFSVEGKDSTLQYESMNISPAIKSKGVWQKISTSFPINYFDESSIIKCYLWNQGKGKWEIDDFKVEFIFE